MNKIQIWKEQKWNNTSNKYCNYCRFNHRKTIKTKIINNEVMCFYFYDEVNKQLAINNFLERLKNEKSNNK